MPTSMRARTSILIEVRRKKVGHALNFARLKGFFEVHQGEATRNDFALATGGLRVEVESVRDVSPHISGILWVPAWRTGLIAAASGLHPLAINPRANVGTVDARIVVDLERKLWILRISVLKEDLHH